MSPTEQVSKLINCLTENEDQRQDLWIHYLSGNPTSTFTAYLDKLNKEFAQDSQMQDLLWDVFANPPSDKFKKLLANFSDIEQSIVCMLAMGLSISELSGYKGISEIRIRHVIYVIKANDCWEELYGVSSRTKR